MYDYFLCSRRGNFICEPFKDASENNGLGVIVDDVQFMDGDYSDSYNDSCDSNREDASQNDYPDEDSDYEHDANMNEHGFHESDDEEAAISRYNKKI